jgi:tryptophan synthase alpha subunit
MENVTQQFIVYQSCSSTTGVEINIVKKRKKKKKKKKKALLKNRILKATLHAYFYYKVYFGH